MAERGNVLFIILLCIIAFIGLVYAVTSSQTGGGKSAADEKAQLVQAEGDNCTAQVDNAIGRLKIIKGCEDDQISYELPDGTNENPDAPADKHCHVFDPAGAGAAPCGGYLESDCDLTALNVGETCDNIVYAGIVSGNRTYITTAMSDGTAIWGPTGVEAMAYNADGMTNTDLLVGLGGYPAADLCRGMGPEWFLPFTGEMASIYGNLQPTAGAVYLPSLGDGSYWTSLEDDVPSAYMVTFNMGAISNISNKGISRNVRCARVD